MTVKRLPVSDGELAEVRAWQDGLEAMIAHIGRHFGRKDSRGNFAEYIRGLLSETERKNGWQLAEQAGHENPYQFQFLLNRAVWDANAVRDDLRRYVMAHLADAGGIGVLDETGFLKKGDKSVGVQRQYTGTAGKVENCQVGVFLGYVSAQGRAFIDRELYLPESWTQEPVRCRAAGVPRHVKFATKPQLGRRMLQRALDAMVPMSWVTGDEVYGNDPHLRRWLESRAMPYVLAIANNRVVTATKATAAQVGAGLPAAAWQRLSAGAGSKGPRLYDWAWVPLPSPKLKGYGRWLLLRRSLADPTELAYYLVFAPKDTPLAEMVRVAGARWAIEELIEAAKGEVGLDQYEVRQWPGWYRHITLALLAHAFLSVARHQAISRQAEKGGPSPMAAFKRSRGL
jgi:SRSO17 transposase